jgi:hypothetical protein
MCLENEYFYRYFAASPLVLLYDAKEISVGIRECRPLIQPAGMTARAPVRFPPIP